MDRIVCRTYCRVLRLLGNPHATGSYLELDSETLTRDAKGESEMNWNKTPVFNWDQHADVIRERLQVEAPEFAGKGGFGNVFACQQVESASQSTDEKYAIKVIPSEFQSQAKRMVWKRRCRREVYWLNKMNHDNIVKYYGYTFLKHPTEANDSYIAIKMEKLDCTLDEIIKDEKPPLALEQMARMARQIGSALKWMHQQGFVHHDIKPANIMAVHFDLESQDYASQLQSCDWKLTDFGEVSEYETTNRAEVREGRYFAGSKFYWDDCKLDLKRYNPYKSDAFAFGMTLLEALLGNKRLREDLAEVGNMVNVVQKLKDELDESGQDYNRGYITALEELLVEPFFERSTIEDVLHYFG